MFPSVVVMGKLKGGENDGTPLMGTVSLEVGCSPQGYTQGGWQAFGSKSQARVFDTESRVPIKHKLFSSEKEKQVGSRVASQV